MRALFIGRTIQRAQGIMVQVQHKLKKKLKSTAETNTKFIDYIKESIARSQEKTIQKTTVGVFGKTGDGKSSLINAILGEKELLPSGAIEACTSVIIQVEAGTDEDMYTATIEFISEEAWKNELKSLVGVLAEKKGRDKDMYKAANCKIEALYGMNASGKKEAELMGDDRTEIITGLLKSKKKTISYPEASQLSEEIKPYIQHDNQDLGQLYWPLVKIVRIQVPRCKELLENVVLVDLPGNGDCNQTRDDMWKMMLRDCTVVWVVSDIVRAAADKAAWEILNSSLADMVQGGSCTNITFICTKTDQLDPEVYIRGLKPKTEEEKRKKEELMSGSELEMKNKCIRHRNDEAKDRVKKAFESECQLQKYFCDRFSVFTVSSQEFCKTMPCMKPEDTEIPYLHEVLRNFNQNHTNTVASQYLRSAKGILSLIQTSKDNNAELDQDKCKLYTELTKKLNDELESLKDDHLGPCYTKLDDYLTSGVRNSEIKCTKIIKEEVGEGISYQTLSALCRNNGYFRSYNRQRRDLNKALAKPMYESIDEEFSAMFPNEGEPVASLRGMITKFSICSIEVSKGYCNFAAMTHILKFLESEEAKVKNYINQQILLYKKKMYGSIIETIRKEMSPAYKKAESCGGHGAVTRQLDILKRHAEKNPQMYKMAKDGLLKLFNELKSLIENTLKNILQNAMEHALKESNSTFSMDVSFEIEALEALFEE